MCSLKTIFGLALSVQSLGLMFISMGASATTLSAGQQAVRKVEQELTYTGRNGFELLYTIDLNIPDAQRRHVLASDLRSYSHPTVKDSKFGPVTHWKSAKAAWPRLDLKNPADVGSCDFAKNNGCLAQVRAKKNAFDTVMTANRAALNQAHKLFAFDHFRNPFSIRLDIPIPEYQVLSQLPTHAAWLFVNGQKAQGMEVACSSIRLGQNLLEGGDQLVGSMFGAQLVQRGSQVMSEMLAETPSRAPLPKSCHQATTASISAPNVVCRALLSEGRFYIMSLRQSDLPKILEDEQKELVSSLRGNQSPQHLLEIFEAPRFTQFCDRQSQQELARDTPRQHRNIPIMKTKLACAATPSGCMVNSMASPNYNYYALKIQDALAHHKALRAIAACRSQPSKMSDCMLSSGWRNRPWHIKNGAVMFSLYASRSPQDGRMVLASTK